MRSRSLEAYLKRRQKDCVRETRRAPPADPSESKLKEGMARAFAEVRVRVETERLGKRRRIEN